MVRTLTWVLTGIILYTAVAMGLRSQGVLPNFIRVQGPLTTIHTKRGRAFLDWLATPKRFWRAWGNFGVGVALVVMLGAAFVVVASGIGALLQPEATAVQQPQNVLVIPGVNDFLPLTAAPGIVFGLLVGLVVHEGGHGLLCRVEDIDIDSMGVALFTLIPVGAFVEPDEESRGLADRGSQVRMFAAGVTNNFAVTIIAFVLLFGPLVGSIGVVSGVPVGSVPGGSAAAEAGIERGDVITGIGDDRVENETDLDAVLRQTPDRTVEVHRKDGESVTVERSLMLTGFVPGVLDGQGSAEGVDLSGETPPRVVAVNGTEVRTQQEFAAALEGRTVITLSTTDGNATFPAGAYVAQTLDGGPLEGAVDATETPLIVTRVDDQRVTGTDDFRRVLAGYDPGDTVTVEAYTRSDDGWDGPRTYEVELGENPDDDGAFMGVSLQSGTSGVTMSDFGIDVYPAEQFLTLMGGGDGLLGGLQLGSLTQQVVAVLFMPFLSVVEPQFSYNFAGFVPTVANFYEPVGPLSVLGGGIFAIANATFWVAWINLQLGFFNLIPAFPLDGGHILRASSESVLSRLPIDSGPLLARAVTVSVSLVMLAGLMLMIFGPGLLN